MKYKPCGGVICPSLSVGKLVLRRVFKLVLSARALERAENKMFVVMRHVLKGMQSIISPGTKNIAAHRYRSS